MDATIQQILESTNLEIIQAQLRERVRELDDQERRLREQQAERQEAERQEREQQETEQQEREQREREQQERASEDDGQSHKRRRYN
ncbi:hypothetical protein CSHISOI_10808 [Colletotrichum shisoi]|uniref:Uncharacterized protein n=1 Tax=Colletotrichum shisoi TaxID=2078593 RepID=A0A5Q4BCH5_9PEZI|nr:hypothetical protein CSHISOI_10808 [Colletotrichum shisoi]